MKFELYKDVVLARDVPEHRLKRGDIVKPVEHHFVPNGPKATVPRCSTRWVTR
jgi:hypothetical protein